MFHHYCFAHEVSMITDHKLPVAFFKKGVASSLQRLQRILYAPYQYSIRILFKCEPQLFIVVCLSRHNHKTLRNEEIPGMDITINAIEACTDIAYYMTA